MNWVENLKKRVKAYFAKQNTTDPELQQIGFKMQDIKRLREQNRKLPMSQRPRPSLGRLKTELYKQGK